MKMWCDVATNVRTSNVRWIVFLSCLLLVSTIAEGQKKFEIDSDECGGEVVTNPHVQKTDVKTSAAGDQKMFGVIEFRRSQEDIDEKQCSLVLRLFVSRHASSFTEVEKLTEASMEGEVMSIALIGFSPDGSKLAADFMVSAGDSAVHRIFVSNPSKRSSVYRGPESQIYDLSAKLHPDFDRYWEKVGSLTNAGTVTITSSMDGGSHPVEKKFHWKFDPWSGSITRIGATRRE